MKQLILLCTFCALTACAFAQRDSSINWKLSTQIVKQTITEFKSTPFIENKDLLIYGLQLISGAADGANQAIVYHGIGKGSHFWDYSTSWKNKYKDWDHGNTNAAFPGSKTWSVMFTDGNHLTRGISRGTATVSLALALTKSNSWAQALKKALISAVVNRIGFTLLYNYILN